ncbi:MAG TPA: hypothetical protein VHT72_10400 [Puia sp.]|jgi:hypothetical protein|nr:hypothetical protein [Puia sp.]
MKKNLLFAFLIILVSCNSNQPAQTEPAKPASDSVAVQDINSPYTIGYSSKFAIGNPKYAENVLTLWKDYDNGTLSAHKDFFADSMTAYLGNGAKLHSSRDSVIAGVQRHRNSFSSAVDRVDAVMAVKSTDKNEDWVLIWGTEIDTYKNGKVDSVDLQETWRINKDGKADMLLQYTRPYPSAKK